MFVTNRGVAAMNANWIRDGRELPDETMDYIRKIAVHAIVDQHRCPELIADIFHMSRSAIYRWLQWYNEGGDEALLTKHAPGATAVITPLIESWLKWTILHSTPADHGYDTELWTLKILVALLEATFEIQVGESTVAKHLHGLRLSCQVPNYRARDAEAREVEQYLTVTWPMIQGLAKKRGATIAFEDETGIGVMTRSGRTWGEVNSPPTVPASDRRGGYNAFSAITLPGEMYYRLVDKPIDSDRYIEFLQGMLDQHPNLLIVIADHASFHRSQKVRDFVRAHRHQIRLFFLPKHAPHLNPDEQVWNEIKHRQLGREPIINKEDLLARLFSNFNKLKDNAARIISFFHLADTRYILSLNQA